ncbi:hypothetical protein [Paenibacillus whitsoniae]|uniref:Uncharacterized protein n=1 Tax=Paenibacillus whitsoniae TaxID=2496558 RepID=A0A430JAV9_9BACL|nr:hypothetical protein [Paenibacillus whitsoniae]RTE08161.1 hypothetical protein EJQ19_18910 [Paenibacillus whitsoniae]
MKKNIINILAICAIFFAIVIFFNYLKISTYSRTSGFEQSPAMKNFGPLLKGGRIEQEFNSTVDSFSSINLFMATYQRKNDSHIKYSLYKKNNNNWEEVESRTVSVIDWTDNSYHKFEFSKQNNTLDTRYKIVITSIESNETNSITAWYSEEMNQVQQSNLKVDVKFIWNGEISRGFIPFFLEGEEVERFTVKYFIERTHGIIPAKYYNIILVIYLSFLFFTVSIIYYLFYTALMQKSYKRKKETNL